MGNPFSIQIFCPDGDPENMRVVTKMGWAGNVFYVSRDHWISGLSDYRADLNVPGIYVLVGRDESFEDDGDDLQTIYIGQAGNLFSRVGQHIQNPNMSFFQNVVCVTGGDDFNDAHFRWMESHLIEQATKVNRCVLVNGNAPKKPTISRPDVVAIMQLLKETLQILPLVEVNAFVEPKAVSLTQSAKPIPAKSIERPSIKNHNQTSSSKKSQIEIRNKIIAKFQEQKNVVLLKRSKATFHNASKSVRVACFISKEYKNKTVRYYLGPTKRAFDFLNEGDSGYLLFGMEGQPKAINFPVKRFAEITSKLSETCDKDTKEIKWWHIKISTRNGNFILHLKGRGNTIDISSYLFDIE